MQPWEGLQNEDGEAPVRVLPRLLPHFSEARRVRQ